MLTLLSFKTLVCLKLGKGQFLQLGVEGKDLPTKKETKLRIAHLVVEHIASMITRIFAWKPE